MSWTARSSLRALSVCAALAVGCGSSGSSTDASGAGGGGASGGGASGGAGGGAALGNCPAAEPADGQACSVAASCFYEDCAGSGGRAVATCSNGAWAVETGPCTGVFCQSQTCAVGQVCVVRAGGALLVDCAANTCGSAAIGCGCLQSCAGTCTVTGSLQTGVTIQCNTCPSNQCA